MTHCSSMQDNHSHTVNDCFLLFVVLVILFIWLIFHKYKLRIVLAGCYMNFPYISQLFIIYQLSDVLNIIPNK